jgi:hypothetical protein
MMFKHQLPEKWIAKVAEFDEFANGATQLTVRLNSGREFSGLLVSNGMYLVAARGFKSLPFDVEQISDVFQTEEDKNPSQRGGWDFWDDWKIERT